MENTFTAVTDQRILPNGPATVFRNTICHENITQLIRKYSNRATVIKNNSTQGSQPGNVTQLTQMQ